jgi:predicted transcriptional regulator
MQETLPPGRHYNSVLTIVRVLARKGHVKHRQEGRGFVYTPVAPQEESRAKVLTHVIDNVFGGSFESIVLNMVERGDLTLQQLDDIRRKLRQREARKGRSK